MNSKFIIILKIKVKLIINIIIVSIDNNTFIVVFFILLNDVVFNIVIDILQTREVNEAVVIV